MSEAEDRARLQTLQDKKRLGELRAKAGGQQTQPPSPKRMTTGESVRMGMLDFFEPLIPDAFTNTPESIKADLERSERPLPSTWEELNQNFAESRQRKEQTKRNTAGVPQDSEQDFVGSMVRGLSDPMAVVGPAKVKSLGTAAVAPIVNAAMGVVPVATGTAVSGALQETNLSPITKELVTAGITPLISAPLNGGMGALASTGKKLTSRVSPSGMIADSNVDAKVKSVIASEGSDLPAKVRALKELQTVIPDVELPLAALARDNPIVESWLKEVSSADPVFRHKFTGAIADTQQKLKVAMGKANGAEQPIDTPALRRSFKERTASEKMTAEMKLERAISRLEKGEGVIASKLFTDVDDVDIGKKIKSTVKAKEDLVRGEASKQYAKAIKEGESRGTTVPADSVAKIYQTAKQQSLNDLFATQPEVIKTIERVWGPAKAAKDTTPGLVDAQGVPFPVAAKPKKPVTLTQFDSLKRAVNRQLRAIPEHDPRAVGLNLLKNEVEAARSAIGQVDPTFRTAYDAADNFYFKGIGMPLTAEGMKSISRSKFESTTAKHLLDFEKANDYIGFVGKEQAIPVIKHALRLAANKAGVVDPSGQVNPAKLSTFINTRQRLIDLAGMGDEFSNISTSIKGIRESAVKHREAYEAASKAHTEGFFKAFLDKELPSVMGDMLTSPAKRDTYLKQIKNLPANEKDMAMTGLKQAFKDKAYDSSGTLSEFILKNKGAAEDLYGKRHVANVSKLFEMADLLTTLEGSMSHSMGRLQDVDILKGSTGVSFSELSGQVRNQVLSAQRKMINLISKSVTAKGVKKRNAKAADILLSTDALEALTHPPKGWAYYKKNMKEGASELGRHFLKTMNDNGIPVDSTVIKYGKFGPDQGIGTHLPFRLGGGALLSAHKGQKGAEAEQERNRKRIPLR